MHTNIVHSLNFMKQKCSHAHTSIHMQHIIYTCIQQAYIHLHTHVHKHMSMGNKTRAGGEDEGEE